MGICRQRPCRRRADRVCRCRNNGGTAPPSCCLGISAGGRDPDQVLPAVLLPALQRRRGWVMAAAFAGGIVIAYLPFVVLGVRPLGFLAGYAAEEGFDAGGRGLLPARRIAPVAAAERTRCAALHDRRGRGPGGACRRGFLHPGRHKLATYARRRCWRRRLLFWLHRITLGTSSG